MINCLNRYPLSFLLVALVVSHAQAAIFLGPSSSRRDRYVPLAPSTDPTEPNPSFYLDESDITGIGGRAALITPQHFVTAAHIGVIPATFRSIDGTIRSYSVDPNATIILDQTFFNPDTSMFETRPSDVAIYTLENPIPQVDGVSPIGIFADSAASIIGQDVIVSGVLKAGTTQAGVNTVDRVELATFSNFSRPTINIVFDFDDGQNGRNDPTDPVDEVRLQGGDSGHQTFIEVGGQLALVGSHFGINFTNGEADNFSSFLSPYLDNIDQALADSGSAFRVTRVSAVPEPSIFVSMFMVSMASLASRRNRTKNAR
ncbi:MAG: trypsin-like serine protease [Planctomycetota bacterium]